MLYNEEIELDEDFEGVDDSEAEVVTEFDEIDENTDYDNNYTYVDINFPQDTPQLIDTPTPVVDPVVEDEDPIPDPEYETVTETYEIIIQDYSQEYLQELEDSGYTFYVVYEDGTEDEVDISEIEEPTASIEFLDDEAYVLANSILEHFWDDNSGVHVTQDSKEDWAQLVATNFPDLDATHPHHNIIVNSYGVLIRSALKNLVQLSRSALAFYDGQGNDSSNIISTFGRGGIQIGPSDQKHLVINNNGITVYNGDGTVAPLTASNIQAIEANIQTLTAADAAITGRLTAAEGNITTLTSSKADVTDLTAATGRITSLETSNTNITGRLTAAEGVISNLDVNYAHLTNGIIDNATIDKAKVNGLSATYATIENLNTANARITSLEGDHVTVSDFQAEQAKISALQADHVTVSDFQAEQANIDSLQTATADIATIRVNSAKVANLTAQELEADHATVGALDTNYAQVNMANVNNAWIQNGTIKDGAIADAMINSVSANKLTAGTIDASNITVTNLNADNITAGTLNGQRIGTGSLSLDKLEEDVYTETEVDGIVQNLQTQIDGAIETWTGTTIPTLQNAPAVNWNTNSIKDTHVGDVYFVVNSQSDQNGYNYRFTKTTSGGTSTYSWQLIKDNDVTNALQRLTDAEGRIGTIETFDTNVSSFMTNTDTELSSIKTAATALAGRVDTAEGTLATKVDTTTFNTLSQTVDGHSSSITQLTTETTTLTQAVDTLNTKTSSDSGNIIQFSDSIGFKEIVVHGKSVQNGTPTPDTPVEIQSVDNLTLHVCGKNLFDPSYLLEASGWTASNGVYTGQCNALYSKYSSANGGYPIIGLSGTAQSYVVSLDYANSDATKYTYIQFIYDDSTVDVYAIVLRDAGHYTGVSNPNKVLAGISFTYSSNQSISFSNFQLELGSTATAYEPYQGQSIDIPLGDHELRSLPDGTDDTLTFSYIGPSIREGWGLYNAELVQNVTVETITDQIGWTKSTGYPGGYYSMGWASVRSLSNSPNHIQNRFITASTLGEYAVGTCYLDRTLNFRFNNDDIPTLDDFKTWLSNNPVDIQYPLITPVTHSLGVVELPLSEDLNLWVSTSPATTIDATWWHEPGRAEKNAIDISLTSSNLGDAITSTTLPAPYTEVEWVESNGAQYVYLDWKPPIETWGFEADFIIRNAFTTSVGAWNPNTNSNGYGNVFGARNTTRINDVQLGTYSTNGIIRLGQTENDSAGLFKKDKTRQQISLRGTTLTKADGTTVTITRSIEDDSKFYANMAVFCMHEGLRRGGTGGIVQPGSVRIYSLKFYDGDELKVDLVGALRNRDGITGLYDKVKDHFYPAYGMTYGDVVGDLGIHDTILEAVAKSKINVHIDNRQISRMWRAEVPELNKLEDGQTISVTFSTNIGATTPVAAGLVGWDETATTAYANVFLKLVLADETETDWIPCFYAQGTRLTSHYGSGTPILLTYRENVLYGASTTNAGTSVMRAWYADPNYVDGNTQYPKYSNSVIAGLNGIKRYTLCMKDQNGKWTSIINQANTVAATKTCYTGGLQLDTILYYSPANEIAAGNNSSDGLWESFGIIDWRYSFNVENNATNGLTYRTPLYLVGTLSDSDGLFYLDTTKWWTQVPNDPTKIYVWVSAGYTNWYQGILSVQNTVYAYDEDAGLIEINVSRYSKTTTKLNQTIDTVDEHTQKIGVLETTIETKADSSDLTTVSNTLNTVSQTATSNSQKITNLTTRLGTNADGTAGVNDIIAKESALEQDLDGFKTTVSSTYTTKTEFNGLELGGRNYALNSEFVCDRSLYGGNEYFAYDLGRALPFGEGTPIVISFDLYMEVVTSRAELFIVYNTNNKGPHEVIADTRPFQGRTVSVGDIINERVVIVGTVRRDRTDANKDHDWLEFYTGYGSGNLFKITNLKLEKGTKVTDWTPAPEEQSNDGLEISGRNLIRNSTSVKMGGSDLNSQTAAANIPMYRWAYSTSNGVHTYTFTEDSNGVRTQNNAYTFLASYIIPGIVEMRNRDYSWALDVKIDGVENLGNNAYFVFDIDMRPSSTGGSHEIKFYANEMADGIWTHIGSSGIVGAADTSSLFEFGVYGLDTVTGSFAISYRNPILVYGNKVPADWSPAPEDQATKADLTAVTTRVSTAESTIEQHSTSIALKANSSDVYTKTQADGLISTEVTNRNAAISAATNAIELSVSETYASKKQLGSRNLVDTTAITSGYLTVNGGVQPAGVTYKEFTSDYIPVSSDKPMIFQYWVSVTGSGSGNGAGWMAYGFYDSNKSWLSSPGRFAKYSGLSSTPTTPVPWHGVYEINDIPSGAVYIRVSWRELSDGIVKLERRDDSDANIAYQVNEAKAAIKVTTDSISTEVSKKVGASEVISKINQSAESVKIQASKVEIDGTAIFNSISFSVDNSISNSISSAKLVKTTQDQWYSSTSATTKSGGSWATTQPSIVAGRYIWQRQYVTYSDNTTAYLPSEAGVCTQGQTDLSGYSTTSQMTSAIGTAKQEALTVAQSAVDITHRIYYRTQTANSSLAAPSTWVEEATGNVYNQWTTKVPPLAANTATGQTKYLYLYTCEQRKRLDGTVLCTKVLLDENTTVIDGGSIITNSVTANQIAAGAITADQIQGGSLTIGLFGASAQADILNSNVVVPSKVSDLENDSNFATIELVNNGIQTGTEDLYDQLTNISTDLYGAATIDSDGNIDDSSRTNGIFATVASLNELSDSVSGMEDSISEATSTLNDRIDEADETVNDIHEALYGTDSTSPIFATSEEVSNGYADLTDSMTTLEGSLRDDISNSVNGVESRIINRYDSTKTELDKLRGYIRVDVDDNEVPYLELGQVGNEVTVHMTNSTLDFKTSNEADPVASIGSDDDGGLLKVTRANIGQLDIGEHSQGHWEWQQRANGNLALKWIAAQS